MNKILKLSQYKKLGNLINSIYFIKNINNDGYIGKFTKIKRLQKYVNLNCEDQPGIYNSLKKYGVQNHTIQILHTIPNPNGLNGLQKLYIKIYDTYNNGLNCTQGGDGNTGHKHTEQTKIKMSIAKKGKKLSEQHVRKNALGHIGLKPMLGKKHSEQTKIKMSIASKNRHVSQQTKLKIKNKAIQRMVKPIPDMAIDQNGINKKVIKYQSSSPFKSEWHKQCNRLATKIYRQKIKNEKI